MSVFEWISLALVVISGFASVFALVVSALVTALWAFARVRDKETQDKLHRVTGRVDLLGTATSRLEERAIAADATAVRVEGTLQRLETSVQGIAVTVAALAPLDKSRRRG